MNSYLVSKMSSFCVTNLGNCSMRCPGSCIHAVVRNSGAIAYMEVGKGREQDAGALRAIRALNLEILTHNLLRP